MLLLSVLYDVIMVVAAVKGVKMVVSDMEVEAVEAVVLSEMEVVLYHK